MTFSGQMGSMMSAASNSSVAALRYACCALVRGRWCGIFLGNVTPAGIFMWCSAPGIGKTSRTDSAKQSANSVIKLRALFCCSLDRSAPIDTCLSISATRLGLCGSVALVNNDVSPPTSISGCGSPISVFASVSWTVHTGFHRSCDCALICFCFHLFRARQPCLFFAFPFESL